MFTLLVDSTFCFYLILQLNQPFPALLLHLLKCTMKREISIKLFLFYPCSFIYTRDESSFELGFILRSINLYGITDIRVATFRFRLNSLCFPCVPDQFPCVFQYINNKYYFYKWPPPPLTAILSSLLSNNNITS